MNQNMSHAFNHIPFYFRMCFSKFFSKHIHCFADYLNMLNKTIENNRIVYYILIFIPILITKNNINRRQNMFKSAFIFNLFSHISTVCPFRHSFQQMALNIQLLLNRYCVLVSCSMLS